MVGTLGKKDNVTTYNVTTCNNVTTLEMRCSNVTWGFLTTCVLQQFFSSKWCFPFAAKQIFGKNS